MFCCFQFFFLSLSLRFRLAHSFHSFISLYFLLLLLLFWFLLCVIINLFAHILHLTLSFHSLTLRASLFLRCSSVYFTKCLMTCAAAAGAAIAIIVIVIVVVIVSILNAPECQRFGNKFIRSTSFCSAPAIDALFLSLCHSHSRSFAVIQTVKLNHHQSAFSFFLRSFQFLFFSLGIFVYIFHTVSCEHFPFHCFPYAVDFNRRLPYVII